MKNGSPTWRNRKKKGVVKTRDNTPHTIENVNEVPLSHVGHKGNFMNVLHILTIQFTHLGCFIEEEGKVIAQGRREGKMFILNTNDVETALLTKGQKVESDIDLWHT